MMTLCDVRRRRGRVSRRSRLLTGPLDWLPELHIEFLCAIGLSYCMHFAGDPMPHRLCL